MVQGQILNESDFGRWIKKIIDDYKPKTILEIGTWKGLGSTKVIIDSILDNQYSPEFISLESNKNFYDISKNNLKSYLNIVNLIHGRIIESFEIENFASENFLTEEMRLWLKNDLDDYSLCENVIDLIPKYIDFLLLDGGAFSTYNEWKKLEGRAKIIALDDTIDIKCEKIRRELLNDDNYSVIVDSVERNGFSIFYKKN